VASFISRSPPYHFVCFASQKLLLKSPLNLYPRGIDNGPGGESPEIYTMESLIPFCPILSTNKEICGGLQIFENSKDARKE